MDVARTLLEDIAHYFVGHSDPRAQLDTLERDRQNTEIEIRAVLDRRQASTMSRATMSIRRWKASVLRSAI